jgi:hypothetical protein
MKSYLFSIAKIIALFIPLSCSNNSLPTTQIPQINRPKTKPFCAKKLPSEIINCLKNQISSHKPEPISYIDFLTIIDEGLMTEDEAIALIKYGYEQEVGNPILFLRAKELVAPKQYSLNFLWIHKNPISESGHLMGSDEQQLNRHVINPLKDWQSKQPDAYINFWYDGLLLDSSHIEETKKRLQHSNLDLKMIRFRDIRDINYVTQNTQLFTTTTPIYFRVDLAKAVIADYVLRIDKLPFVINIDSDIVAVARDQLFDYPTLTALNNIGYAFGTATTAEEENSFIMLHNSTNINILDAHKTHVIDSAALKAKLKGYTNIDPQDVFSEYNNFRKQMRLAYRNKTGKAWSSQHIQKSGKFMIFPKSQFAFTGGYDEEQIILLRKALINPTDQNRALLAK